MPLLFLAESRNCLAGPAEPVTLERGIETYSLRSHFAYYVDPSGGVTVAQAEALAENGEFIASDTNLNVGITSAACWVRFSLSNPGDAPQKLVLVLGTPTISKAVLYIPDGHGGYTEKITGDVYSARVQDYFHRHLNFGVSISGGEQKTVYLRLTTDAILETSLTLYTDRAFVKGLPFEYFFLGLFYSAFGVAIIYNLFLFASLRDTSRLFYVLYATVFCLLWFYLDGLWFQVSLKTPFKPINAIRVLNALSLMLMLLFTCSFFNCRKNAPHLFKIFMFLAVVCAINTVMVTQIPLAGYNKPLRLAWLVSIPLIIFSAILFWRRGFLRARYFLMAWLFVLGGAAIFLLDMYLNLFPGLPVARSVWKIESVMEIILLSLALADRINELNLEKEQAQAHALKAERDLKENLEHKVRERTTALRERSYELEKANQLLEKLSQMDGLTGLYNRRYFDSAFVMEWKRMHRCGGSLCLILLDIDFFKNYNDTFGHQAGDDCLKKVANIIKSALKRSSDICARYGGEEFVIVLPEVDHSGGMGIAEELCSKVRAAAIPHDTDPGIVTVSIGVAALNPISTLLQPKDLIRYADKALYRAKSSGRNRVESYPPSA
ncbi:MAG: diguanylate cyclase [Desulfobacter sp.]|nr:MAG: diguanylate cyclase [Desulfobacter sp.]